MRDSNDRYNLPARLDHTRQFTRKNINALPFQGMPVTQREHGFTIETDITASFFSLTARESIAKGTPLELRNGDNGGAYIANSPLIHGIAANDAEPEETVTILRQGNIALSPTLFPRKQIIYAYKDGTIGVVAKDAVYVAGYTREAGDCLFILGGSGGAGGSGADSGISGGQFWGRVDCYQSSPFQIKLPVGITYEKLEWPDSYNTYGNIPIENCAFVMPVDGVVHVSTVILCDGTDGTTPGFMIGKNGEQTSYRFVTSHEYGETRPFNKVYIGYDPITLDITLEVKAGDKISIIASTMGGADDAYIHNFIFNIFYLTAITKSSSAIRVEVGGTYTTGTGSTAEAICSTRDTQLPETDDFFVSDGKMVCGRDGLIYVHGRILATVTPQSNYISVASFNILLNGAVASLNNMQAIPAESQYYTESFIDNTVLLQVKKDDTLQIQIYKNNYISYGYGWLEACYIDGLAQPDASNKGDIDLSKLEEIKPIWGRMSNLFSANKTITATTTLIPIPWGTDVVTTGNFPVVNNQFVAPKDGIVSAVLTVKNFGSDGTNLGGQICLNGVSISLPSNVATSSGRYSTGTIHAVFEVKKDDVIDGRIVTGATITMTGASLDVMYVQSNFSIEPDSKMAEWGCRTFMGTLSLPQNTTGTALVWPTTGVVDNGNIPVTNGEFVLPRDGVIHITALWHGVEPAHSNVILAITKNGEKLPGTSSALNNSASGAVTSSSSSSTSIAVEKGDTIGLFFTTANTNTINSISFSVFYIDANVPDIKINDIDGAGQTEFIQVACSGDVLASATTKISQLAFKNPTGVDNPTSYGMSITDNSIICPKDGLILWNGDIFILGGPRVKTLQLMVYLDDKARDSNIEYDSDTSQLSVSAHGLFYVKKGQVITAQFSATGSNQDIHAYGFLDFVYLNGTSISVNGGQISGGGTIGGETGTFITNITKVNNEEREIGKYNDEPLYERIIDITSPAKVGEIGLTDLTDWNIKRITEIASVMDADGCFFEQMTNNSFALWYSHVQKNLRCQVLANYTPYCNAPVRVTLRYTKIGQGADETLSSGNSLENAPLYAVASVESGISIRYIVPVNTTWDRGKKENYVENQTLPLAVETGKQYKLISPFGTQVCIADAYLKHGDTWQKVTGTDWNATNAHKFCGIIVSAPGDGYVYLSTGTDGLVAPVMGLSAPYVADNITTGEVVIVLYCPDEGIEKDADIIMGGGCNCSGGSGGIGIVGGSYGDVASLEQRQVGYWIDNKPLYQKTFVVTTPANAGTATTIADISDLDIEKIIEYTGSIYYSDSGKENSVPVIFSLAPANYSAVWAKNNYADLIMRVGNSSYTNKTAYIKIFYTKKSDKPLEKDIPDFNDKVSSGNGSGGGIGIVGGSYGDIWDFEERQVGYWIDNRPLYQIVYPFSTPATVNIWTNVVDITALGEITVITVDGAFTASTNHVLPLWGNAREMFLDVYSGHIREYVNNANYTNKPGYIRILYTKSSDTPLDKDIPAYNTPTVDGSSMVVTADAIRTRETTLNNTFQASIEDKTLALPNSIAYIGTNRWAYTVHDEANDGFEVTDDGYILCKKNGTVLITNVFSSGDSHASDIYFALYVLAKFPDANSETEEDNWTRYASGYQTQQRKLYWGVASGTIYINVVAGTLLTVGGTGDIINYTQEMDIEHASCTTQVQYVEVKETLMLKEQFEAQYGENPVATAIANGETTGSNIFIGRNYPIRDIPEAEDGTDTETNTETGDGE